MSDKFDLYNKVLADWEGFFHVVASDYATGAVLGLEDIVQQFRIYLWELINQHPEWDFLCEKSKDFNHYFKVACRNRAKTMLVRVYAKKRGGEHRILSMEYNGMNYLDGESGLGTLRESYPASDTDQERTDVIIDYGLLGEYGYVAKSLRDNLPCDDHRKLYDMMINPDDDFKRKFYNYNKDNDQEGRIVKQVPAKLYAEHLGISEKYASWLRSGIREKLKELLNIDEYWVAKCKCGTRVTWRTEWRDVNNRPQYVDQDSDYNKVEGCICPDCNTYNYFEHVGYTKASNIR